MSKDAVLEESLSESDATSDSALRLLSSAPMTCSSRSSAVSLEGGGVACGNVDEDDDDDSDSDSCKGEGGRERCKDDGVTA